MRSTSRGYAVGRGVSDIIEKGDYVRSNFNHELYRVNRVHSGQLDLIKHGIEEGDKPLRYPDAFSCPVSRVTIDIFMTAAARANRKPKKIQT